MTQFNLVLAYIVAACAREKDYFDMAVNHRNKAKECGNQVWLGM